jgi:hypothetical protein
VNPTYTAASSNQLFPDPKGFSTGNSGLVPEVAYLRK